MWNTPDGMRTLDGAEAILVRSTIHELVDEICTSRLYDHGAVVGIGLFDRLSWQQQLAMLRKVARGLLLRDEPVPEKSSALVDAATGAIYRQMLKGLEMEVELQQDSQESHEDDTIRREEVVAALNQRRPGHNWPHSECVVMDEWETAVFEIQSWVLADEDWVMDDLIADQPPSKSDEIKSLLGIDTDYLIDIPPDVDGASAAHIWADLIELVSGERPDESVFERW